MTGRPGSTRRPPAARSTAGRSTTGRGRSVSGRGPGTSAARFRARARAARWRAVRQVLTPLLVVAVLAALGWACWSGPLLRVRSVQVVGLHGTEAAQVRAVGTPYRSQPLPQVDTGSARAQVAALPYVRDVQVERGWPSTLRLRVVRRVPVAAVRRPGGGFALLDTTGRDFQAVAQVPHGIPLMTLPAARRGEALSAALAVLAVLPEPVRGSASQISATSPADVRVRWQGRLLVWGTAADLRLKARVLRALLRHPARVYDVSAPHTPVLR